MTQPSQRSHLTLWLTLIALSSLVLRELSIILFIVLYNIQLGWNLQNTNLSVFVPENFKRNSNKLVIEWVILGLMLGVYTILLTIVINNSTNIDYIYISSKLNDFSGIFLTYQGQDEYINHLNRMGDFRFSVYLFFLNYGLVLCVVIFMLFRFRRVLKISTDICRFPFERGIKNKKYGVNTYLVFFPIASFVMFLFSFFMCYYNFPGDELVSMSIIQKYYISLNYLYLLQYNLYLLSVFGFGFASMAGVRLYIYRNDLR